MYISLNLDIWGKNKVSFLMLKSYTIVPKNGFFRISYIHSSQTDSGACEGEENKKDNVSFSNM